MSVKISTEAWEEASVSGNPFVVLLKLADNADDERRLAWPSVGHLAARCRISERTVQRALRELVEADEISIVAEGGVNGARKATIYSVHPGGRDGRQIDTPTKALMAPVDTPTGDSRDTLTVLTTEPSELQRQSQNQNPTPGRAHTREAGAGQANVNGGSEEGMEAVQPKRDLPAEVWAFYVATMKPRRTELPAKERQIIREALKVASVDECIGAIRGCSKSPFHMGDNDRRTKYNQLPHILKGKRDGRTLRGQIDYMLSLDETYRSVALPSEVRAEVQAAKHDIRHYAVSAEAEPGRTKVREATETLKAHGIEWRPVMKTLQDGARTVEVIGGYFFSDEVRQ